MGYHCTPNSALVWKSTRNHLSLIERLRPKCLHEIAVELQELLKFHHEVGVISPSFSAMYEVIFADFLDDVRVGVGTVEVDDGAVETGKRFNLDSLMDIDDGLVPEEEGHREMHEEGMRTIDSEDTNTIQTVSTA